MNIDYLFKFIDGIEQATKNYSSNAEIIDNICDVDSVQQALLELIADAKRLIKYGEGRIALENLLENMLELKTVVYIDRDILDLARCAFGNKLSSQNERLMEAIMIRFSKQ